MLGNYTDDDDDNSGGCVKLGLCFSCGRYTLVQHSLDCPFYQHLTLFLASSSLSSPESLKEFENIRSLEICDAPMFVYMFDCSQI